MLIDTASIPIIVDNWFRFLIECSVWLTFLLSHFSKISISDSASAVTLSALALSRTFKCFPYSACEVTHIPQFHISSHILRVFEATQKEISIDELSMLACTLNFKAFNPASRNLLDSNHELCFILLYNKACRFSVVYHPIYGKDVKKIKPQGLSSRLIYSSCYKVYNMNLEKIEELQGCKEGDVHFFGRFCFQNSY